MNKRRYFEMLDNAESEVCHNCRDLDWRQNMVALEGSPGRNWICQYCQKDLRAEFPDVFKDDEEITWKQFDAASRRRARLADAANQRQIKKGHFIGEGI